MLGILNAIKHEMNSIELEIQNVESKIYIVRGMKVMLDEDLAKLYEVPTKRLNQQVQRNQKRFPSDFMFSLTDQEVINLKLQIATSNKIFGRLNFIYPNTSIDRIGIWPNYIMLIPNT